MTEIILGNFANYVIEGQFDFIGHINIDNGEKEWSKWDYKKI